ncbi:HNH endonuclease signature motif containing protein [Burkholderia gladioli]|uniref:HNH endonuclease signature motif containing protein n=1 Tax=Burkholderia gladioli TaxID=28095 RepID=UPI00163F1CFA|nr:HNH endonuclease signature motif containing protein [Burkholderia gladioli]
MDGRDITADRLRDVMIYDAETGEFTWIRSIGSVRAGSRAGMLEKGYRRIKIDGRFYLAHRLAWLYMNGVWPASLIDHRNGDRDDNRWTNLRECNYQQNAQNTASTSKGVSGLKGVHWHESTSKWRATIMRSGRNISLGLFLSKEAAHAAYVAAKSSVHEFQPVLRDA